MSKPKYVDDGKEGHELCADCEHWKVSHSAFSGCVAGYTDDHGVWHDCPCYGFVPKEGSIINTNAKEGSDADINE